jgi:hypothetical protein
VNDRVIPVGNRPIPVSVLSIEGDQTSWGLGEQPPAASDWGDAPLALATIAPLVGTLLLSPARVGSVAITPPPPGDGWSPAMTMVAPYLYIPTTAGLPSSAPGYELSGDDTNLAGLQTRITKAMTGPGSTITVSIVVTGLPGTIVLNGKTLPFVVLAPAT